MNEQFVKKIKMDDKHVVSLLFKQRIESTMGFLSTYRTCGGRGLKRLTIFQWWPRSREIDILIYCSLFLHRQGVCVCFFLTLSGIPLAYFRIFLVWEVSMKVSIAISFNSEVLSSAVPSLLTSPLKAFFILVTVCLISSISLWFFFGISISCVNLAHLFFYAFYFVHVSP